MSEPPPAARPGGPPLLGTFLKLPRPEVVEVLALAELDFLICDTEHGQVDEREARQVVLAGRAVGIPIVVRVPAVDTGQVNRLLESGAAGIQLSGVSSAQQARSLRQACNYPPSGRRGVSTAQPAGRYGRVPVREVMEAGNRRALCVGQLESTAYDDELAAVVADLDVAFIGVMDLSVDLGVPGATTDPGVTREVGRIHAAAAATGTSVGIFAPSVAAADLACRQGFDYIAIGSDLAWLAAGSADLVADVRGRIAHDG